ncbi:hypothetical protein FE772_09130 [Lysobacter enzymogenes]|nr:hypothetical protein [Lysobacter enzymogenes]QCW25802.1 hypothetical protein FE772_09130 [Lysobacter enzymogenes]
MKAQQGDVKAAIKLANHYQWAVSDQANATIWLKKGVELGDPWAMINLSSITAMEGGESRCKEAEALLQKVLEKPGPAEAIASARSDLEILRSGVNGSGYCVKWLGGKK